MIEASKSELIRALRWQPFDHARDLQAGDVLKLTDGSIHLVGDVNQQLGVCEDCTVFNLSDVAEIANLWDLIICDRCLEVKISHCTNACGT